MDELLKLKREIKVFVISITTSVLIICAIGIPFSIKSWTVYVPDLAEILTSVAALILLITVVYRYDRYYRSIYKEKHTAHADKQSYEYKIMFWKNLVSLIAIVVLVAVSMLYFYIF